MSITDEIREIAARLGPLPISLQRLLTITASPEFDFAEIVDVVAHDMLLTTSVLSRANAAANGPARRIQTARDAVMRIGAVQTLAAAMQGVVRGALQQDLVRYQIPSGELWRHSTASSLAAALIRGAAAVPLPTSVATTALLHDLGKISLDTVTADGLEVETMGALVGNDLCTFEREAFGIDHAAAGAIVAELWKLPNAIVEGIASHHDLIDDPLPSAICLADYAAHAASDDEGADHHDADHLDQLRGPAESARLILGISEKALAEIVADTRAQTAALFERFEPAPSR